MAKYSDVRQAIEQEQLEEARELLRIYLEEEPDAAEAWYLASKAAVNDKQRQYFLEKAVACDPLHHAAANGLHALLHPVSEQSPLPQPRPQAVAKQQTAPLSKRAIAFLIDYGLLFLLTFPLLTLASILTGGTSQAMMIWMMLNSVAYVTYFGYSFTEGQGQTIGKRLMQVRVVKRNGQSLTWWDAFLRCWVGYLLSIAPLGLGFLWALVDDEQRGWHDIIADTQVVEA